MILAIIERFENVKEEEPFNYRYYLTEHYKDIFDKLNILLFPIVSDKNLEKVCEICDGLIVTGSCIDIPPHYYNEEPIPEKNYDNDEFKLDKAAIELFSSANKPILGICGGLQSINVCFGGSLNQKIENHNLKDALHIIKIKKQTFLSNTYNIEECIEVNSFHKQSIKKLANNFIASAIAEDGTIEAIENGNIIAVQWHPEKMGDIIFFNNFIKTFFSKGSGNSHNRIYAGV
jgi:putative glutamine amidotransferase